MSWEIAGAIAWGLFMLCGIGGAWFAGACLVAIARGEHRA